MSFENFMIGNNIIVVDEDGIRIANPTTEEEITFDWETYYAIHDKASSFYEELNDI